MRFLLINQFFAPDAAPTGRLLADVSRALVNEGHSVKVVCGRASYTRGAQPVHERDENNLNQLHVCRLRTSAFGKGFAARLFSYGSFYCGMVRHALVGPQPDVIVTLTTPPLLGLVGTLGKLVRGSRHFIWEMDVYPDVAVALGVFQPGGFLDRSVGMLADFSRHRADGVIALGRCMSDRLIRRGICADKIKVAENWADGSQIVPRPFPSAAPLTVLYSGNFGRAHEVETICEVITRLTDGKRFRFVFAGGGAGHDELKSRCAASSVSNSEFLPYQESGELADHLGRSHIGLVTQQPATCGAVVPSKTYSTMAAGRPYIFIGPRESTPGRLIEQFGCGWHIEPGDATSLVTLLEGLSANPEWIAAAGERAREAFLACNDLPAGTARIVKILTASQTPRIIEHREPKQASRRRGPVAGTGKS